MIASTIAFIILLVALIGCIILAFNVLRKDDVPDIPIVSSLESRQDEEKGQEEGSENASSEETGEEPAEEVVSQAPVQVDMQAAYASDYGDYSSDDRDASVALAKRLRAMYDYDSAIAVLSGYTGSANDSEIQGMINQCTSEKNACVPVDVTNVPHVFFHSCLNDSRGFRPEVVGESVAKGNECWMTTTGELKAILQQMYDHGCVLIHLHDLAVKTENEDGSVTFAPNNNLLLPEGKTAVIMSEDDLSYYHSYDGQGYATKLVLDENGKVKCEYTDENGNTSIGDYDVVPVLSSFIEEHPDFSYKNAHLTIAMTGYNGCFGYRTDESYVTGTIWNGQEIGWDKKAWLEAHPDFNIDNEIAEAKKIADALKGEGYDFASHTWGHVRAGSSGVQSLIGDQEAFRKNVVPIIGDVDTIIFAHGEDIGDWHDYSEENSKFSYYKSEGYDYYCNVDGSQPSWIQIRSNYVRTGRVDLDGYRLWKAIEGEEHSVADVQAVGLHDIESFLDPDRITPIELVG